MELIYYTVGFNAKYINLIHVSIESLRKHNLSDIMVICDESLVDICKEKLGCFHNIIVVPCKDSINFMDASMKKVLIFDYDISKYSKVMFIDADILVGINLSELFEKFTEDNKIYVFADNKVFFWHKTILYSLNNYTDDDIAFFEKNKIYPFNCGLFAFLNTPSMLEHFNNIRNMIKDNTGNYYYEQSFMNVYFNTRNLTDTQVFNSSNCIMGFDFEGLKKSFKLPWTNHFYKFKIIHFCAQRGYEEKFNCMIWWKSRFGL